MNKRGQITFFVVIGLVLTIIVGFSIYIYSSDKIDLEDIIKTKKLPEKIVPIKNYVDECLRQVTPSGIYLLAAKGGYIYSFNNVLNSENQQVAYHMMNGNDVAPKKGFMEYELSKYIEGALKSCVDYFQAFDYYEFEFGEMEIETEFTKKEVLVDVNYPVTIIIDESRTEISKFHMAFPARIGYILEVKEEILEDLKNTGNIDFVGLSKFDVEVNMMPYGNDNLIYSVYDEKTEIGNAPLLFNFAVKIVGNNAPRLEFIPDFVLRENHIFNYHLEAHDQDEDVLSYSIEDYGGISTSDISVDTDNYLSYSSPTVGDHVIEVCVSDGKSQDCDTIRFMVNG